MLIKVSITWLWECLPKSVFVEMTAMKIVVYDATIFFKYGNISQCIVLRSLSIYSEENIMQSFILTDCLRVVKTYIRFLEATNRQELLTGAIRGSCIRTTRSNSPNNNFKVKILLSFYTVYFLY